MAATFTKRYSKPTAKNLEYVTTSNGGWSRCVVGKPTDAQCNVLSNCVGYACGRFNEIINEMQGTTGMKYPYLNCNAENFIERCKQYYPEIQFSDKPQEGAIMCWQKGTLASKDGAGHVAIVEEVIDNNTVKTSESAYAGTAFYSKIRSNDDGRWGIGSAYSFRAFILNPAVILIEPVERDESVDQVNVKTKALRMRRTPDDTISTNILSSYCPLGYFNVLETKKVEGKSWGDTWYRIDENIWIAGVEDVEFLAKKEEPQGEIEELRKENVMLKDKLARISLIINE